MHFRVLRGRESSRLGLLTTPHGTCYTPVFMPVGTRATVKGLTPEDLQALGAEIILANTYHLWLRPGSDLIKAQGGLHRFMNWPAGLLTDSGGYQVFSLAPTREIREDGVVFQSHLDGSRHFLSPEVAVKVQEDLGADIIMCLDECAPYPVSRSYAREAMERTVEWAGKCQRALSRKDQALFAVVQGGMFLDLRRECCERLVEMDFAGYALGGLSVGEPPELMREVAAAILPLLPADKPRYLMGVGSPEDLVELMGLGVDMFDCVLPTRNARNGMLFTSRGRLVIKNSRHRHADLPIDEQCSCYTCRSYSRAYLRHLFATRELLAYRLNTIHNLWYFLELVRQARRALSGGWYEAFKEDFYQQRQQEDDN
ncbi:MAG: tRNA guanosine(34) transglycosylase Tgt [Deltaproteobacteria bacterium]|nr:tRNA guanosine(34) transglycosylase Tgt [Deltaproteobacteria bacterium]MBW2071985.1 tRNA guanosine(34) transglycosylase Tgt [Deltaproteobacteria bacterium]